MPRPYTIEDTEFLEIGENASNSVSSTSPSNIKKTVINFFSEKGELPELEFAKKTKKIQYLSSFEQIQEREKIVLGDKFVPVNQEFKVVINECDEITRPSTPVNTTPNPTPYVPRPKTYVYTGVNPITKIIEGWTTTVVNSKSPTEALPYYLHVTLME